MHTQSTGWCRECPECEGQGVVTEYQPYYGSYYCDGPEERVCDDCDGTGVWACSVCGYDKPHDEYDCYGCYEDEEGTLEQRIPPVAA